MSGQDDDRARMTDLAKALVLAAALIALAWIATTAIAHRCCSHAPASTSFVAEPEPWEIA